MIFTLLVIILVLVAAGFALLLLRKPPKADDTGLLMLQGQLDSLKAQMADSSLTSGKNLTDALLHMQEGVGSHLKGVSDSTNTRLDAAAQYMMQLQQRLGTLTEKTDALASIGRDISRLSDIFQSPKLRGNLGELILDNLLSQMLPREHYALQYRFQGAPVQVDAVLKLGGRLVPVDAKFPLDPFRRLSAPDVSDPDRARLRKEFFADVKKHIVSIAEKYIRPDEGTYDFALMYVPSETIYYEVITRGDDASEAGSVAETARKFKVIPVSPNSLYAYLQVILFGLKGMEIEKSAQEIQERLKKVQVDFKKFYDHFTRFGVRLDALKKDYDDTVKRFELLDKQVGRITGNESLLEAEEKEPTAL
ncbi:MAG: DNA recombination protein RmuC [Fibrobacterota bacterium]